jgi:phosphoribosyl-ATP pyrophosphohydrolase/phosphoribosyl-AMP cyclohydrolase
MPNRVNWDKNPLIPAVVQDSKTNRVLMLAYMNKEALELSIKTNTAHYFSRSKQRIWQKGESSGNIQKIDDILIDCDNDTILLKVEQVNGIACHTGRESCFFTSLTLDKVIDDIKVDSSAIYGVVDTLYHTILDRKNSDPKSSYTASLFHKGENSILKKVVEEAGEFSFAIKDNKSEEIIYECADLLYHTLVALAYRDISPDRVKQEIARRFGMSGIEEKNSREN